MAGLVVGGHAADGTSGVSPVGPGRSGMRRNQTHEARGGRVMSEMLTGSLLGNCQA